MKIKKITLCVLLALGGNAFANDHIDAPSVSVSANPLIEEIHIDPYSSTSAVVTQDQIRDLNAVDIASALRTTPGVEISRYNPVGGYAGDQGGGVYIRGIGTSRPGSEIKTYIDGVPFYSPVWGHSLLDILPVNGMSSITVYKSPQPQINGNNFASINLTSRSAVEDGVHADTRMSAGSFGTVTEQASISMKKDNINFVLSEGFMKSDGHRANADGELKNVMGRLGIDINDHWKSYATFLYTDNYARDPNPANLIASGAPKYATEAGMATVGISHDYGNLKGDFKAYYTNVNGTWYNSVRTTWWPFDYKQRVDTSGLKIREDYIPWLGASISAGLDFDHASGTTNAPDDSKRDLPNLSLTSPYVSANQNISLNDSWILVPSVGVRLYEHNVYSSKTAPHAGLSLVSDRATFFANASRGVNFPGQEALAVSPTALNWRSLSPMVMNHYETGFKLTPEKGTQIDVSIFHDQVIQRWAFDGNSASTTSGDQTDGAELALRKKLGEDWLLFSSYTWLNPTSTLNLPYMPRSSLAIGINGHINQLKVSFDAQHQTKMWANTDNRASAWRALGDTKQVDGFTVANVRVSYPVPQLGSKGEVFVAVENLFDEKYEYAPGYIMPGISGQVGFVANF